MPRYSIVHLPFFKESNVPDIRSGHAKAMGDERPSILQPVGINSAVGLDVWGPLSHVNFLFLGIRLASWSNELAQSHVLCLQVGEEEDVYEMQNII